MNCLSVPLSIADADRIVAACSGLVDWRPMFILGLQTAVLFIACLAGFIYIARRIVR